MTNYKNCKLVNHYILGQGSISQLINVLPKDELGYSVYCIDYFFEKNQQLIIPKLPIKETDLVLFIDTTNEPKAEYIDELVDIIKNKKNNPKAIIGIGGGSTMDISKAISILLTNEGKAEDYQGWDLVKNEPVFKIGIPTISGTGAEFTRTCVLTSRIKKLGINSPYSVFDQVILDPELLKSVPKDQFFFTAMDCFVHNVESLRGSQNDALTIAFAEKSLSMMKEIFFKEMDLEKLMVASLMGGVAVANSNVGICHPLSYGLSLVLGLHHGFAICIAFNQLEEYYPEVKDFKMYLKEYEIKLPKIINDNISEEDIDRMVQATLLNEKPLENAFGKDWRTIFTPEKVKNLILKM